MCEGITTGQQLVATDTRNRSYCFKQRTRPCRRVDGSSAQKRFSGDGNSGGAEYKVLKRWACAALVVKKVGGMSPDALGPWKTFFWMVRPHWHWNRSNRHQRSVGGGRQGARLPRTLSAISGHWSIETCVQASPVGRCELAIGSPKVHCLVWMSIWGLGCSNDDLCKRSGDGSLMCQWQPERRLMDVHWTCGLVGPSVWMKWNMVSRIKPMITLSSGMRLSLNPKLRPSLDNWKPWKEVSQSKFLRPFLRPGHKPGRPWPKESSTGG